MSTVCEYNSNDISPPSLINKAKEVSEIRDTAMHSILETLNE